MLKLNLVVWCLFSSFTNSHTIVNTQVFEDLAWVASAEKLGTHIKTQLETNNTRFAPGCGLHLLKFVNDLLSFKLWALQMLDAGAKIPSGLLRGNGAVLGSFEECLKVQHLSPSMGKIQGKYCLGRLRLVNLTNTNLGFYNKEARMVDLFESTINVVWGSCLPATCSAKDFEALHLSIVRFSEESCQTKETQSSELDNADIAAISLLGVLAGLIVLSTIYDTVMFYRKKGSGSALLKSFSLLTNGTKIVTVKNNHNDISCIHGLRVLTVIFLVYGLRYIFSIFTPLINWFDVLEWITDKNKSMLLEAAIVGDTFFVITGTLISYNYLIAEEQKKRFNLFIYYLRRIIRLTPALGMTILIHATILRHIGSGPVWPNMRNNWLVNNCREFWWSSLLYVQNYVNGGLTTLCLIQTWQLSVDMQLFILSPLILIPLKRAPKYTLSTVGFLLFCSILSPFLSTWVYRIKAIIVANQSMDELNDYVSYYFLPTHTRASPWLIGFILGYIIFECRKPHKKIYLQKKLNKMVFFLWILALGSLILCIVIGRTMNGVAYNWVSHAFHIALIRPLWSTGISFIIFTCVNNPGGPVNNFLSLPTFQVLSRVTYGTYLMNITVMYFLKYQTTEGVVFSDYEVFIGTFGDLFFSFLMGFVWTLAFESPIIAIMNIILEPSRGKEEKSELQAENFDQVKEN